MTRRSELIVRDDELGVDFARISLEDRLLQSQRSWPRGHYNAPLHSMTNERRIFCLLFNKVGIHGTPLLDVLYPTCSYSSLLHTFNNTSLYFTT